MRILQLISSAGVYGAERMILTLSQALIRSGVDCTIAVLENVHPRHMEVAEEARRLGIPMVLVPCSGRLDLGAVRVLRTLILEGRHEILHTHGYKADVYGYMAVKACPAAIVSTCHNWLDEDAMSWVYGVIDRLVLKKFDSVVTVSTDVTGKLYSGLTSKARIIANGIDLQAFAGAVPTLRSELQNGSNPLVGFVGRLSREKGPHDLLRAAAVVVRMHPTAKFAVVGDGPEEEALKLLAADLGISGNVHFCGARSDMPAVYASLDLLVQPSLMEGMPMTVLEALAAKSAVIATGVGAVPQIIVHEDTGLLVRPSDCAALGAAIIRLLNKPDLRRRLGEKGYCLVRDRYSAETMAAQYRLAYQDAIKTKAVKHRCYPELPAGHPHDARSAKPTVNSGERG